MANSIEHRFVRAGDVRLHVAEAGSGPLVVLLHGFPEVWYAWRHQIPALAGAGFRVVAVDQRGYGRSDRPEAVEKYSILHLVGDVVQLIQALGEESAVVVGHDWGAEVAWQSALMRPDLVRGVAGLSLPYRPRGAQSQLADLVDAFGDAVYYNYFQCPGRVDAELAADPSRTFRSLLRGGRKRTPEQRASRSPIAVVSPGGSYLDSYPEQAELPGWLTEEDVEVYASEFSSGFTGALNWYRAMELSWQLTAFLQDSVIRCPALYVVGEEDRALNFPGVQDAIKRMNRGEIVRLPGVGHWTQEEAPEQVNEALVSFVRSVTG